jgi:hypothetical protein
MNTIKLPWNGQHWPGTWRDGLPTFRWRDAPAGLATRRQLRKLGRSPNGHDIVAQVICRRGRRWAGLYLLDRTRPSPGATERQLENLAKANRARLERVRNCQYHDNSPTEGCRQKVDI